VLFRGRACFPKEALDPVTRFTLSILLDGGQKDKLVRTSDDENICALILRQGTDVRRRRRIPFQTYDA